MKASDREKRAAIKESDRLLVCVLEAEQDVEYATQCLADAQTLRTRRQAAFDRFGDGNGSVLAQVRADTPIGSA